MSSVDKRFSVEETIPGVYEFTTTAATVGLTKVYVTFENSKETKEKKLYLETQEKKFTIKETFKKRPYFVLENETEIYLVGSRNILIEGMNNFRDIGGYATDTGKHVKWGMLYRSDQLGNATEKGLAYFNTLGIKTIIDYRSLDEINKYPNPNYSSKIVTYQLDPNAHAAELSAQFQS